MKDHREMQFEISVSIQTDSGCVRDTNEDAACSVLPSDPQVLAEKGRLTIVADGMGGHSGGEVASALAVEAITSVYYSNDGPPGESLKVAFEEANRRIFEASVADKSLEGMGTTCTALVLHQGWAVAAHVGDSRLYLIRNGQIYLLTEDHSAVREMVKLGVITAEQARHHEDKNVILRALGTTGQIEVSMWEKPLTVRSGDQFVLCSDGLYDLVEDETIGEFVLSAPDVHSACEVLVEEAKRRGGHDNITLGVISIKPAGYPQERVLRETREAEVLI